MDDSKCIDLTISDDESASHDHRERMASPDLGGTLSRMPTTASFVKNLGPSALARLDSRKTTSRRHDCTFEPAEPIPQTKHLHEQREDALDVCHAEADGSRRASCKQGQQNIHFQAATSYERAMDSTCEVHGRAKGTIEEHKQSRSSFDPSLSESCSTTRCESASHSAFAGTNVGITRSRQSFEGSDDERCTNLASFPSKNTSNRLRSDDEEWDEIWQGRSSEKEGGRYSATASPTHMRRKGGSNPVNISPSSSSHASSPLLYCDQELGSGDEHSRDFDSMDSGMRTLFSKADTNPSVSSNKSTLSDFQAGRAPTRLVSYKEPASCRRTGCQHTQLAPTPNSSFRASSTHNPQPMSTKRARKDAGGYSTLTGSDQDDCGSDMDASDGSVHYSSSDSDFLMYEDVEIGYGDSASHDEVNDFQDQGDEEECTRSDSDSDSDSDCKGEPIKTQPRSKCGKKHKQNPKTLSHSTVHVRKKQKKTLGNICTKAEEDTKQVKKQEREGMKKESRKSCTKTSKKDKIEVKHQMLMEKCQGKPWSAQLEVLQHYFFVRLSQQPHACARTFTFQYAIHACICTHLHIDIFMLQFCMKDEHSRMLKTTLSLILSDHGDQGG
jgi:hypothetical protein